MVHTGIIQTLLLVAPAKAEGALANTQLYFVVGLGRSGTKFLSHLLDKVPGSAVYHETRSDRDALVEAYYDSDESRKYLLGPRRRIIAARIIQSGCRTYGEVNSYLRHHVDALQSCWQPTILHLVRDGRSVVRSLMNRETFTSADKDHSGRLKPHPGDPMAAMWTDMDRFERACWYWESANRYLMARHLSVVRLEDIVQSFELFAQQVLEPLGTYLPSEVWNQESERPRNISRKASFPNWQDWTPRQKTQFRMICGDVMTSLGYEI